MKVNIQYETRDTPWGGANQFLKFLKNKLIEDGIYCEDPNVSDFVIFNSHHALERMWPIRKKNSNCKIIHRVDGPIYKIRNCSKQQDVDLLRLSNQLANIIVFQSEWSKKHLFDICKNEKILLPENQYTIINSCDYSFFKNRDVTSKNKFLISTWSNNTRKGFGVYSEIDNLLYNEKYSDVEITFIGRSPIVFKNIKMIAPVKTKKLASIMSSFDGYITASRHDPCSNALCEAVQSGLKILALNDGGHPEVCNKYNCSHILFDNFSEEVFDDFIKLKTKDHNNYDSYKEYLKILKNELTG